MVINFFEGKYRFLSNFYSCWIPYEGITYPTSEHAYQAAKTLDVEQRKYVSTLDTPGKAKRAGRDLTLRSDWEQVKESVMYDILKIKFSNPILREKLLETGDVYLIEGNKWCDQIWGMCQCKKCNGLGLNLLGKLLMKLRNELKPKQ